MLLPLTHPPTRQPRPAPYSNPKVIFIQDKAMQRRPFKLWLLTEENHKWMQAG